jgi:hypothetical protein
MLNTSMPDADRVLLLDAPIEAVVVLDRERGGTPALAYVFSVGLSSLDQALALAKKQGWPTTVITPGTYQVGDILGGNCIATRALGTAPARLVCGERARDVESLYPYAARGLPTETLPESELRIEIRMAPLRELAQQVGQLERLVVRELARDDPAFDHGLGELVRAVGREIAALTEDAEQIAISMDASPTQGIRAVLSARLRQTTAFTTQTIAEMGRRASLPPEIFWQLPGDAAQAVYGVSPDLGRLAPIRRRLGELVDQYLDEHKVSGVNRRRVSDFFEAEEWSGLGSAWVSAQGKTSARSGRGAGSSGGDESWTLLGFEGLPSEKLTTLVKKLLAVYQDPAAKKALADTLASQPNRWPRIVSSPAAGFGRGSTHYAIEPATPVPQQVKAAKPEERQRAITHVLIVPSGGQTWVGVSRHPATVTEKLKLVIQRGSPNLSERAGLASLRESSAVLGGFTTLAGLVGKNAGSPLGLFAAAPYRGETPVFDQLRYVDQGPSLEWRWTVPRAAITDIAAVLPQLAKRMFR